MSQTPLDAAFTNGWSRRRFLQMGTAGAMLTAPEFLWAGSSSGPISGSAGRGKSCIFIFQQGGPSHIDTWDMKPDAPLEFRGPLKPIPSSVPGTQVCELMPRLARRAHRYGIIRSMTHGSDDHDLGLHMCLSGQSKPTADAPYIGAIVSKVGSARQGLPAYVWIQDLQVDGSFREQYKTGGYLGVAHAPLRVCQGDNHFATPNFRMTAFDPPPGVSTARAQERCRLLDAVDIQNRPAARSPETDRFRRFQERAFDLVTGPAARQAFEVDAEPVTVRDRYGRHPLGQNLLVARRLVEAGVHLVSVHAFTGFEPNTVWPPVVNVWDMHGAANRPEVSIFAKNTYGLPWCLPRLDEAVSALLDDLDQRGLLSSTLVVLVGEFGRTPRVNAQAGRDHYGACFSALLAGAGVRGGAVYGSSDKVAAFPKDRPVTPEDFGATIFHALGISPDTPLSPDDFTRRASKGQPVLELFG